MYDNMKHLRYCIFVITDFYFFMSSSIALTAKKRFPISNLNYITFEDYLISFGREFQIVFALNLLIDKRADWIVVVKNPSIKTYNFEMSLFMFLCDELVSPVRVQGLNANLICAVLMYLIYVCNGAL